MLGAGGFGCFLTGARHSSTVFSAAPLLPARGDQIGADEVQQALAMSPLALAEQEPTYSWPYGFSPLVPSGAAAAVRCALARGKVSTAV